MVDLSAYGHEERNVTKGMNRREFFSFGLKKSGSAAQKAVEFGVKQKFKREILRPPGALPEPSFLLTCTRCGDCVPACPHKAIHLVHQVESGVHLRTPFIDVSHRACEFCEDFPCIESCKPGALKRNIASKETNKNGNSLEVNPMGVAKVQKEHCLSTQGQICDYCRKSCPPGINALTLKDRESPEINEDACVGCGKCAYICVSQTGKAITIKPL